MRNSPTPETSCFLAGKLASALPKILVIAISLTVSWRCAAQITEVNQILFPSTPIKGVPGSIVKSDFEFTGVNDNGIAVGILFHAQVKPDIAGATVPVRANYAFIYREGKFSILDGPLPGPGPMRAVAINNLDQVLVHQDAADGPHYFLYAMRTGTYSPVGLYGKLTPNGPILYRLTELTGLNDRGEVAGFLAGGDGVRGTAMVGPAGSLSPPASGTLFTIIKCPAARKLFRTGGINNNGDIAGSCGYTAFVSKRDGTYTTFAGPPRYWMFSGGLGINDAGTVVGFSNVNGARIGFIYLNGQFTALPSICAMALNNHGQIAGLVYKGGRTVFTISGAMTQLQP